MKAIKFFRIFLLVLIIIGIGLLCTQKIWAPKLVQKIIESDKPIKIIQADIKQGGVQGISSEKIASELSSVLPKNKLYGSLVFGTTTQDDITFYVLPLFQIKSTSTIASERWGSFEDLSFKFNDNSIEIYKADSSIKKISSHLWDKRTEGIYDIITFDYSNQRYFVMGGGYCGNGGCEDENLLLKVSGTSDITDPIQIFRHSWTWRSGGLGFQGEEKLDFVLEYNGQLFLFPNGDSPIVVIDKNGNIVRKINDKKQSLSKILTGNSETRP